MIRYKTIILLNYSKRTRMPPCPILILWIIQNWTESQVSTSVCCFQHRTEHPFFLGSEEHIMKEKFAHTNDPFFYLIYFHPPSSGFVSSHQYYSYLSGFRLLLDCPYPLTVLIIYATIYSYLSKWPSWRILIMDWGVGFWIEIYWTLLDQPLPPVSL